MRLGQASMGSPSASEMVDVAEAFFRQTDAAVEAKDGDVKKALKHGAEAAAQTLKGWGFDIEASKKRCLAGWTMEADDCQLTEACESVGTEEPLCSVGAKLRFMIDVEELLAHIGAGRHFWESKGVDEKFWSDRVKDLTKEVKAEGFQWSTRKECVKLLKKHSEAAQKRVFREMSAGEGDADECHEASDKMCPEGTFATTKRRRDMMKFAGAMSGGAVVSKFTLLPLGSFVGGAIAGPPGAVAGGIAGNFLGLGLAATVSYFASRGPLECACFDRDCFYDSKSDVCALDETGDTKNVVGAKLPVLGMKCSPKEGGSAKKGQLQCGLEQCSSGDFGQKLSVQGMELFGTVGRKGRAIFNCVSDRPSAGGSLVLADELPSGVDNSPEERAKFLSELLG